MKNLSFRLPDRQYEALLELAETLDKSPYATMQDLIRASLESRGYLCPEKQTIAERVGIALPKTQKREKAEPRITVPRRLVLISRLNIGLTGKLICEQLNPAGFDFIHLKQIQPFDRSIKNRIDAGEVILITRFISHVTARQVRDYCFTKGKECHYLPKGYGPTAILAALNLENNI